MKTIIKKGMYLFEVFTGEKYLKTIPAESLSKAMQKAFLSLPHYDNLKVVETGHKYV